MKKPALILIAAALVLSLSGCGTVPTGKPVAVSKPASSNAPVSTASSSTPAAASSQSSSSAQVKYNYNSKIFGNTEQKYEIKNPKTYFDKYYAFSVDYPANWGTQADGALPSGDDPDHGIDIFINGDKNNWIRIYGVGYSLGGNLTLSQDNEYLLTNSGLTGIIQSELHENRYQILIYIFEDSSQKEFPSSQHGVSMNVSKDCLTQNKAQILGVLKSIKVYMECKG